MPFVWNLKNIRFTSLSLSLSLSLSHRLLDFPQSLHLESMLFTFLMRVSHSIPNVMANLSSCLFSSCSWEGCIRTQMVDWLVLARGFPRRREASEQGLATSTHDVFLVSSVFGRLLTFFPFDTLPPPPPPPSLPLSRSLPGLAEALIEAQNCLRDVVMRAVHVT